MGKRLCGTVVCLTRSAVPAQEVPPKTPAKKNMQKTSKVSYEVNQKVSPKANQNPPPKVSPKKKQNPPPKVSPKKKQKPAKSQVKPPGSDEEAELLKQIRSVGRLTLLTGRSRVAEYREKHFCEESACRLRGSADGFFSSGGH